MNILKFFGLGLLFIGYSVFGAQSILTVDSTDPEKISGTSITITNAAVITATNSISSPSVIGATTSAGAGDSGKVVKLNASGQVDSTMLGTLITSSSRYLPANVTVNDSAWTTLLNMTNTTITGSRIVSGLAQFSDSSAIATMGARVLEVSIDLSTTNIIAAPIMSSGSGGAALNQDFSLSIPMIVRAASATNIYILQGFQANGGGTSRVFKLSGTSSITGTPTFTNATYITIINHP